MPKILITGNGFDLNLGLPTSYSDFINILNSLEQNRYDYDFIYSQSSNNSIIQKNFKTFQLDKQRIELLKNDIQNNLWYRFFKDEFEIESWIDFENKIEYVLTLLFSSIKYIKDRIFANGSQPDGIIQHNVRLFNNNQEIIQVLNKFNVISFQNSYDIFLNEEFLVKKYDHFIDVNLDNISKKLNLELIGFKKIFNQYFEIFVFPFYDNVKIKVDKNLYSVFNKHYTFNYTPTFERIYHRNNITNFLHGEIDSNTNQIVLGINEIPSDEIDNKYFLPFTKYFQKLNNNTDYEFIKQYENKISDHYIFCFFGHSLDKSDEDYINEVFDFIISVKRRTKKIIVIYHDQKSKSQLIINLLNIRGKKDIVNLMKSKVLVLMESNTTELKRLLHKSFPSPADNIR